MPTSIALAAAPTASPRETVPDDPAPLATTDAGSRPGWPVRRQLAFVTIAWMFGAIWHTVTTGAPLTLFAKGLGASHFQFGLLAAMPYVAALLAVPGSLLVERTGDRKRLFLDCHFLQRGLWFVIAAAPLVMISWYGEAAMPRAVTLFLALVFLMYAAGATGGPAWVSWMADVVPKRVRGAYFARRRMWGISTAVPTAVLIGWGLDKLAGGGSGHVMGVPPVVFWCGALFLVVAFFGLTDIALFRPLPHAAKPPRTGGGLMASMLAPVKDKPFMALSCFVGAINFTVGFTNQFATLYVIEKMKVDHVHAQLMLLAAPMLLTLLLLPAWGAAVDKMGRKPLMILSCMGLIPMGFGWCVMGEGNAWLGYVLYAGGATLWTGIEVANFNAVIDASGKKGGGSGYHAVNTVIINAAGCLGGLTAGGIAALIGSGTWQPLAGYRAADFYDALFTLSGSVRVLTLVLLAPLLWEPGAKGVTQTATFLVRFTLVRLAAAVEAAAVEAAAALVRRPFEVPAEPATADAEGEPTLILPQVAEEVRSAA